MMDINIPVITIDGPGGAGKGTVGRLLARDLGFHFLDSGALYRLLAVAAQLHGIDLQHEAALCVLAEHLDVQFELTDPYHPPRVIFEGEDITEKLRLESTGNQASTLAANPEIRVSLLERQRAFLAPPGLVADGRDMGTVVFPQAQVKIFLTASAEERAQRRYKELQVTEKDVKLSRLLEEIRTRDERDANRSVAPLRPAEGAYLIDTTGLSIDQALAKVKEVVSKIL